MEILLKGVSASKGTVEGKVKVLHNSEENHKVEKGDIIVISLSSPLFTPAILKASAIITDYGGVLSHAAIVARELEIPAVVGTEKSTKILKDGDSVVVDGTKGVVYGAK